jgi:hypothetical protein
LPEKDRSGKARARVSAYRDYTIAKIGVCGIYFELCKTAARERRAVALEV